MNAIRFHQYGGPEVLVYESIPEPLPGPGEAIIEVKAASINHLDIFVRRGIPGHKLVLPHTPGSDAAGTVVAVGEGVTDVTIGDRVVVNPGTSCGKCEFCIGGEPSLCATYRIMGEQFTGAYANYVRMPAANLVKLPDTISYSDAAALALTLMTSWRMIVVRGNVRPGEEVLILGGGSGVGVVAIQLVKMVGARAIVTASSPEKRRLALELGADLVVDPKQEPVERFIRRETQRRGVDVVIDYVGKDTWVSSLKSLRNGGRLLTCGATSGFDPVDDLRHIFFRQLTVIGSTMGSRMDLELGIKAVLAGQVRAVIHGSFPLKEAAHGQRLLENREAFGKVVLIP